MEDIVFAEIKFKRKGDPGEFIRSCTICAQTVLRKGAVNVAGAQYLPGTHSR